MNILTAPASAGAFFVRSSAYIRMNHAYFGCFVHKKFYTHLVINQPM